MIMVSNNQPREYVAEEMKAFIGDSGQQFADWLWEALEELASTQEAPMSSVIEVASDQGQADTRKKPAFRQSSRLLTSAMTGASRSTDQNRSSKPKRKMRGFEEEEQQEQQKAGQERQRGRSSVLDRIGDQNDAAPARSSVLSRLGARKKERPLFNTARDQVATDGLAQEYLQSQVQTARKDQRVDRRLKNKPAPLLMEPEEGGPSRKGSRRHEQGHPYSKGKGKGGNQALILEADDEQGSGSKGAKGKGAGKGKSKGKTAKPEPKADMRGKNAWVNPELAAAAGEDEEAPTGADAPVAAAAAAAPKKPCWYFTQGKCTKGDACPFSHTAAANGGNANGAEAGEEKKKVCIFFLRGACTKGDSCVFSHDAQPGEAAAPAKKKCSFFLRGACNKGAECAFSHEVNKSWVAPEAVEIQQLSETLPPTPPHMQNAN
eukprot:TRINITY_DN5303_c0_g1_i3.p1 TRINITY_DN5303_c0_g1~~TRINITY_DN5303_c0_g1_i3.p1  ORF type:complete len:433 (-),score=112.51 TRINITY_DN5303_c0_g1_i3:234-1532(-)